MDQTDNRNFRTTGSVKDSFTHSCLGRLVILGGILLVVLFLAHISVPDQQTMTEEIEDDIRQCIIDHDSIPGDWIDDAVGNVSRAFTSADSTLDEQTWAAFNKYNRLEYYKRAFYSSIHVHNNMNPQGHRVGIGIFGLVIPTVNYSDLLLHVEPMHKGYDRGLIQQTTVPDTYMGESPHIKEYHYKGEEYN